jgi:uncharacterized protein (TIGR02118 family)
MIKVTAVYPYREGARMDADYYVNHHVALVRRLVGPALKGVSVDRGIASLAPGQPPPFVLMAHFLFDSLPDFQAAFGPHAATVMGDLPNYSDIAPTLVISETLI